MITVTRYSEDRPLTKEHHDDEPIPRMTSPYEYMEGIVSDFKLITDGDSSLCAVCFRDCIVEIKEKVDDTKLRAVLSVENGIRNLLTSSVIQMLDIADEYYKVRFGRSGMEIAKEWKEGLHRYCNYNRGHSVSYRGCPNHTCINQQDYEKCLPTRVQILACKIWWFEWYIDPKCMDEHWGN